MTLPAVKRPSLLSPKVNRDTEHERYCPELEEVTFLNPGTWTMENPFTNCPKLFTIKGYAGSMAETFASRYNYLFKPLE